jgi:ELWxxDGT repeat protein
MEGELHRGRRVGIAIVAALACAALAAPVAHAAPGAALVRDINTTGDSAPEQLVDVGGTLYFAADDGVAGTELWKSDAGGTDMVADIVTGPDGSFPSELVDVGGTLFFTADDGANGSELWTSDGTPDGTQMVEDIDAAPGSGSSPTLLTAVGGTLYFTADDGTHGFELFKSDGTPAGTGIVEDINPNAGNSFPDELTNVGGTLFFSADDGTHGFELFESDGTPEGTDIVEDINPGALAGSFPAWLTDVNGTLFFSATDGAHGFELWKRDGSGAAMVEDINPNAANSSPTWLTESNGTLLFTAADGTHGAELFKSDGTGADLVADLDPAGGSSPELLTDVNGTLFFAADDGTHGLELFRSDGAGAALVRDINPTGNAFPDWLTDLNGTLFFSADDGAHGFELWTSDGSSAGTIQVADINPATGNAFPEGLTAVGGTLYFAANDGAHGTELWKSDQVPTATAIASSANPAAAGQAVTFTATVSAQPGRGTPTGSVVFGIDGSSRPPVTLAAGHASIAATLAPGEHRITAAYHGAAGFADSASAVLRQIVNAPVAPPGGGTTPLPDTTAPVFESASLTRTVFAVSSRGSAETPVAAARRGTTFRYTLSEAARVLVTIRRASPGRRVRGRCVRPTRSNRKARRCTRLRLAGRFAIDSPAGATRHRFSGRIGAKRLAAGRYRVTLIATDDAGNSSLPKRLRFRVVKG